MNNYAENFHNIIDGIRADFYSKTAKKNLPEMLKGIIAARDTILSDDAVESLSGSSKVMANTAVEAYNEICRKMRAGKHADAFNACLAKYNLPAELECI